MEHGPRLLRKGVSFEVALMAGGAAHLCERTGGVTLLDQADVAGRVPQEFERLARFSCGDGSPAYEVQAIHAGFREALHVVIGNA